MVLWFFKEKSEQLVLAYLIAQSVKNLPAVQETQVRFLDWEDPREKEMATHSSILAWRIPGTEEPGRLQSMGSQVLDMTELLNAQPSMKEGMWYQQVYCWMGQ